MRSLTARSLIIACLFCCQPAGNAETKYQFYQLVKESEVVIDATQEQEQTFDRSIQVQVASFKDRNTAAALQQKLGHDFRELNLRVTIVETTTFYSLRLAGFRESRTMAFVIDQLVQKGFAPLKIRP
jgi:hypothetical protein